MILRCDRRRAIFPQWAGKRRPNHIARRASELSTELFCEERRIVKPHLASGRGYDPMSRRQCVQIAHDDIQPASPGIELKATMRFEHAIEHRP